MGNVCEMKKLIPILACVLLVIPCKANQVDFNSDGVVDFLDFSIFAQAWKTQDGDPNFNPVCDISDPNDGVIDERDLDVLGDSWLWSQIVLDVYSDGWGTLLDTFTMEEEGLISFYVEEEYPYYDPPEYYAYARRLGYYTELYYFTGLQIMPCLPQPCWRIRCEVEVDLDQTAAGKFNGVIFLTQWYFADGYLANTDVNVLDADAITVVTQFHTDDQGRFVINPLPPGSYYLEFYEFDDDYYYHLEPVVIEGGYQDFFFPYTQQAYKPNIYLYPEETMELDVDILFPHGGEIIESVPEYGDGWHITVEPSGIIDGQYDCLFYESLQPDYGQYDAGWTVAREELEDFFRNNMAQTAFIEAEIDDFIEYWIPLLTDFPYYAIYPQYNDELDQMIQLEFSTQPQSLIRLIYSVRGLQDNNLNLQQPAIPPFARYGFTVTEWGVILK